MEVTTGFLDEGLKGRERMLISPSVAVTRLGVIMPRESGFKGSTKTWEDTRDAVLRDMSVPVAGQLVRLSQPITHPSLWLIDAKAER